MDAADEDDWSDESDGCAEEEISKTRGSDKEKDVGHLGH